ncbi:M66 family metalloprotease [Vibrio rhodolitus]|uniref:M66 family metalloprotease n=1 Tax=Vibrio rhodolitus TaxID=2231649 RepID=UPI000E0CA9C7|nr:M66 family metalloprotease [Vibrio rhodolitus]
MRLSQLSLLIGGVLASSHIAAETLNLSQLSAQVQQQLFAMQQLATDDSNIVVHQDGRRFLQYQGKQYWVNHENFPKFPLNDAGGEYSTAFPFVDSNWEYIAYNGGFYLMHRELGVMNANDIGCYVEYLPASRGSQLEDGSYITESDMILRTVMSDCGELAIPNLESFKIGSLSDIGVELTWDEHHPGNDYVIDLTARPANSSPIVYRYRTNEPGLYISDLEPNTRYEVEIEACNDLGCAKQQLSFTTLAERLAYNDSRTAVNHLSGSLRAHINFTQTHTSVMPNGNDELNHPNLVMDRAALLLVTPNQPLIQQMWVEVELDGISQGRFALLPPSALADTDQPDNGRSKVVFSKYAWSLPLQWDWMKPGLSLKFSDNRGREGVLAQNDLVFAGAPEMVIQNIDIGMLVEPRDQYEMIDRMPELATDYFQKIPVSKLVMADYTPLHLRKVTLPNGKVYTRASEYDNPGVYAGDMREYIGKRLISMGINNANFGIVDTAGGSAHWARPFSHITAHNNRGRYLAEDEDGNITSSVIHHGLSGGGGMVTLSGTRGNEWSHELGHNYGRGHHPKNASIHDMESGWGWDARYNRFIGNLHWSDAAQTVTNTNSGESVEPFADQFRFMREAMGGGESARTGLISHYTLEHPIAARVTQNWFNGASNVDTNSATGYSAWDQETQRYVESATNQRAVSEKGVPVITVLGIYDPTEANPSQIYPLIYSNYGNLFELPEPSNIPVQREGWVAADTITAEDRLNTEWQTIKVDNQWLPLCQFSYTSQGGTQANFIGYEEGEQCRVTSEMVWHIDGQTEVPVSESLQYQLLASKGELVGNITYTPTPELGEMTLCSLNKPGTGHDGAGFLADNKCKQIDGMKHSNGALWAYATHQGGIDQYQVESQKQCQLVVENQDGSVDKIALHGKRYSSGESNKFHLNLPAERHPERISIECSGAEGSTAILDTVLTPRNPAADELVGPVIVGQENGYQDFDVDMPSGWMAHNEQFNPEELTANQRSYLATMRLGEKSEYVCRFPMTINGNEKLLHGYVESFGNGDYQCTGGSDITVRDNQGEREMVSELNQFEWLSLHDRSQVGAPVIASPQSNATLCSLTKGGEWYGVGFVNAGGQCVQEPEVYWSNGNQWIFSSGYAVHQYR